MVDTGIQQSHPAFDSKQLQTAPIDLCGHGIFVAGIACGTPFQGMLPDRSTVNCRGVAPKAKLVIYKACDNYQLRWDAVPALKDLSQLPELDVVVMCGGYPEYNPELHDAIKRLDLNKVIIVCAASNEGARDKAAICYPARYPETICIGSHDEYGNRSRSSPVGEEMDFLAPGEGIFGPCYDFEHRRQQGFTDYLLAKGKGTSLAAPAVGGLICLILEAIAKKCPDKLDQIHNGYTMKKLLQKLTSEALRNPSDGYGSIKRDQVMHFFEDPKFFIKMLVRENVIK